MTPEEFINAKRVELGEKSEHWSGEELFSKLQSAYVEMQLDVPFAVASETIAMTKGTRTYPLLYEPIKNISMKINDTPVMCVSIDTLYGCNFDAYAFNGKLMEVSFDSDNDAVLVYRYSKEILTLNDVIDIPVTHMNALVMLWKSKVYEKPKLNTKERDMSIHYMKLYESAVQKIRFSSNKPTAAYSTYKRI